MRISWRRIFSLGLLVAVSACTDEIPAEPLGGTVSGVIHYAGKVHKDYSRPAINVQVQTTADVTLAPDGVRIIPISEIPTGGIPYAINLLAPGEYAALAVLLDLDQQLQNADGQGYIRTAGGYPTFCDFVRSPFSISVSDDRPNTEIDIAMWDDSGRGDPCFEPSPDAGLLLVEMNWTMPLPPLADTDVVRVATFPEWPPTATTTPSAFAQATGAELGGFPAFMRVENVPPGRHAVALCFDKAGDNFLCDGANDFLIVYDDGALLSFTAGGINSMIFNFDDRSVELVTGI